MHFLYEKNSFNKIIIGRERMFTILLNKDFKVIKFANKELTKIYFGNVKLNIIVAKMQRINI